MNQVADSRERYSFRLRIELPSSNHIASDDELWMLDDVPNVIELRPAVVGKTLREAQTIVIFGRNYSRK